MPFAAVDILPDPRIRQELSALSNWPTIPQLFVGGELVGGADIVAEMYESGELAEVLGVEAPQDAAGGRARRRGAGARAAGRREPPRAEPWRPRPRPLRPRPRVTPRPRCRPGRAAARC